MGPGEGVLASGDRGICPEDFLLDDELWFLVFTCSLCLRPCREEGRVLWPGDELSPEPSPVDSPDSDRGAGE